LDPVGIALLLTSLALSVAVLLPGGLRRKLEAFEVQANREPMADTLDATVHTLVVRNRGRHAARNIRIVQAAVPQVRRFFPAADHSVGATGAEVVLRKLPPHSQVTMTTLFDASAGNDPLATRIECNGRDVSLAALEDVWTLSRWKHSVLQVLAAVALFASLAYAAHHQLLPCSGGPWCLFR
jgi:hypothetical protein